ncbi:hypothetical protein B5807_04675 [Epicoccum nigrum]|uniref:Uncharacterized protein n=1 Tax=Epicoccum nigrum TaxID=105696 RepID=A0A1Y2M3G0_EPING|nr:hypothetical protein B5807_04675 [Epicoccum nigrum]
MGRELVAPANVGSTTLQASQQQNMLQQPKRLPQQAEDQFINQLAKKLMDGCKPEVRAKFKSEVNSWPDQKMQQILQQGVDPLFFRFRVHVDMLYRTGKVPMPKQQGANPMKGQQLPSMKDPNSRFMHTFAPYGDYTDSSFYLSDNRAIEAQDSNSSNQQLSSISPQQSGIQGTPGQLPLALSPAAANPSYVTPTMWQEVVADSFQPRVKRGLDQGSSSMIDQSMQEIPLLQDDYYGGLIPLSLNSKDW